MQNMINYGNSRALIQISDRPVAPPTAGNQPFEAWGSTGSMIEGQPLAIEYNSNILEDQPATGQASQAKEIEGEEEEEFPQ